MTSTAIDLIVPYYGERSLLEQTVMSVLAQSSPDWRLVVVEDGDQGFNTGEWLGGLGDARVHHVLNPTTLGVAGNFQRCLDLATSPYVSFPGCDDLLLPDYVAVIEKAWRDHTHCAGVIPGVGVVDQDGARVRTTTDWVKSRLRPHSPDTYQGERLLTSLMHGNWTYFPATCWRTDAIRSLGFRADLPTTLDLALLAELVLRGESFLVLEQELFEYRRHPASASSLAARSANRFAEERALMIELADRASSLGWRRASRAAKWHWTSRAHALSLVCASLRSRHAGPLLTHGLTRRGGPPVRS
jgi:glycosyltransferase involved in cell wall biosynthesis